MDMSIPGRIMEINQQKKPILGRYDISIVLQRDRLYIHKVFIDHVCMGEFDSSIMGYNDMLYDSISERAIRINEGLPV